MGCQRRGDGRSAARKGADSRQRSKSSRDRTHGSIFELQKGVRGRGGSQRVEEGEGGAERSSLLAFLA